MMDVCYLKGRGWLKSKKLMKRKFNKGKWIRFGAEDLYKYLCLLNFPGNYVIFYYKKPIYIGQSLNIKNRLNRYFLNELKNLIFLWSGE